MLPLQEALEPLFDDKEIKIIELFEDGGTYRSVAAELQISPETIRQMLRDPKRSAFQAHYARAREEQGHAYADGVIDVVYDSSLDPAEKRVRIDGLKWTAGKRKPTVYGDKITQEHVGANGGAIQFEDVTLDAEQFASRMASIAARSNALGDGEAEAGDVSAS